ncbi:MAG: YggS family pyridoxal phosphate-dependent enzyme, partial [Bradymonadaceae bacterium]
SEGSVIIHSSTCPIMNNEPSYDPTELRARREDVRRRMARACEKAGRSLDEVCLVAVSKTHPPGAIEVLYEAGVRDFGESYVQEWLEKAPILPADIRWHFIGGLQSNKARFVVEQGIFLVHSVDRKSLAKQLATRTDRQVDVLIQVDVSGEETKGGVPPDELFALFEKVRNYSSLRVRGLMTMPPYADDPEESRPYFQRLRVLLEELLIHCAKNQIPTAGLEWLSMGMTNDFEVAIEEGATHIRVGTALFGERTTQ